MKHVLLILLIFNVILADVVAQVGINADNSAPNSSAGLDVKFTNKGFLPPRMTTTQRNGIPTPATGLMIYNMNCNDIQYYNGAGWIPMGNAGMLATPGTITGITSICANSTGITYSIAPVANATGYHWTVPSGATITAGQGTQAITVSFGTTSGVVCVAAYNDCYRSNMSCLTVTLTSALPVSVTIAASSNPVCVGTSVMFTATPVNGGATPAYVWKKNGMPISGATNVSYTYVPANNDIITCQMTSSAACISGSPATSNAITMNVITGTAAGISIAASANPVCAGTSVTYTSTPVNGGGTPAYQWKVNGSNISGATNSTLIYTPANSNQITCVMTSNALCATGNPATSNVITMSVTSATPVSVAIKAAAHPLCSTTSYTYNAIPTNGGSNPTYQWSRNYVPVAGATNTTYTLSNPGYMETLGCQLTSNATCYSGSSTATNSLTMNDCAVVCYGSPIQLICNFTDGCGNENASFSWTNSSGSWTSTERDPVIAVGATGYATDAFYLTINYSPPPGGLYKGVYFKQVLTGPAAGISIAASANPVCAGTSVTYTATPVNGGTTPAYQWKVNGSNISGATNSTLIYTPANSNQITCVMTSNALCATGNPATSNVITMSVTSATPVSVAIKAAAHPLCSTTAYTYNAIPTNGGSNPIYQWSRNYVPVAGATNSAYTLSNPGYMETIDCQLTSNSTCYSGSSTATNPLTMNDCEIVCYGSPIQLICNYNEACENQSATFFWTNSSGSWTSTEKDPVIAVGATGYATDAFYLTSYYAPPPGGYYKGVYFKQVLTGAAAGISIAASANPVCAGTSVTYTATPVNGGATPAYQWKVNGSSVSGATNSTFTNTPANNNLITCVMTSNAICATGNPATSNVITMSVTSATPVSVAIKAASHPLCSTTAYTYNAIPTNGGSNPIYQWSRNYVPVAGATNATYTLSNPGYLETIDCQLTSNSTCYSGSSTATDPLTINDCEIVCYGTPIQLLCTFADGCGNPTATFFWTNSSGSWTSTERDPVIAVGATGYATDSFYLTINYSPPPGGYYKGVYFKQVKPLPCSK